MVRVRIGGLEQFRSFVRRTKISPNFVFLSTSHRAPESLNFVHWKFVKLRGLLKWWIRKSLCAREYCINPFILFEQLTNIKACSELWSLFAVDKHFLCPFSNLPIFRLDWRWCASPATHMRPLVMMTTTMLLLSSIQYLIFEGTGYDLDSFWFFYSGTFYSQRSRVIFGVFVVGVDEKLKWFCFLKIQTNSNK